MAPPSSSNLHISLAVSSPAQLYSLDYRTSYLQHHSDGMADIAPPTGTTVDTVSAGMVRMAYWHGDHMHTFWNVPLEGSSIDPTDTGTVCASQLLLQLVAHHATSDAGSDCILGGELSTYNDRSRKAGDAKIHILFSEELQTSYNSTYVLCPCAVLYPGREESSGKQGVQQLIAIPKSDASRWAQTGQLGPSLISWRISDQERQIQKEWQLDHKTTVPFEKQGGSHLSDVVRMLHDGLHREIEQGAVTLTDGTVVPVSLATP